MDNRYNTIQKTLTLGSDFNSQKTSHIALLRANYGVPVVITLEKTDSSWWRHQMEIFSTLLSICAGNSPVSGELSAKRPATRSFDVFFDLCLNKRLSKQSRGWWFERPYRPLWRHCNVHNGPRPYAYLPRNVQCQFDMIVARTSHSAHDKHRTCVH